MCYPQCKGLTQTDLFNLPNNPVSQVYKEHFTDEETEIQKLPKITQEVSDRARIQTLPIDSKGYALCTILCGWYSHSEKTTKNNYI